MFVCCNFEATCYLFFRQWFCGKAASCLEKKCVQIYWYNESMSMNRWTDRHNITEVMLKLLITPLTDYHTMPHFDVLKTYSFKKQCEKGRNCL